MNVSRSRVHGAGAGRPRESLPAPFVASSPEALTLSCGNVSEPWRRPVTVRCRSRPIWRARVSLSHTGQALQPTIGGGADAALSRASTPQPTTPPAEETRVVVVGLGACGGGLALDAAALASVRLAASPLACPQQPVGGRGGSDRAAAPQTAQRPAHWREEPQHVARRSTLSTDGFIPLRHRLIA